MDDAKPPRPPSRLKRWLAWCSGGFGLVLALVAGAFAWLAFSESGARFVLERGFALAGGSVTGVQGSLAGPLAIESLELASSKASVKATRITLDWRPSRLAAGALHIESLHAATLEIESVPSGEPAREPATLAPPFAIRVAQAGLDRLVLRTRGEPGAVELQDLSVKLAGDRTAWIVGDARAMTPVGLAQLSGAIGANGPYDLDAKGALEGLRGERKYGITLSAKGPLAGFEAAFEAAFGGTEGGLEGGGMARISPFDATPLRALSVKLSGLDLSAFANAPQTKLAVEANLAPAGDHLLTGPVKIVNTATGPLDRNRIPVASLAARLSIAKDGSARAQGAEALFAGGGGAKGDLAFAKGKLDAALDVRGLDLLAWHTKLKATALAGPLRAETTQDVQSFTLDLADPRFSITGAARFAKDRLEVERVRVARTASGFEASGTLALKGKREFTLEGRLDRVNPANFAKVPEGEISGGLKASGQLGEGRSIQAVVDIAKSRFAGLALEGHADVAADESHLGRIEANLAMGETRASASGAFGRAGDSLSVKLASPDLAPLGKAFGFKAAGHVDVDALVEGTLAAPYGRAAIKAGNLALPGDMRLAALDAKLALGAAEDAPLTGDATLTGLADAKAKEPIVAKAALTLRGTRAAHDLRIESDLPENSQLRLLVSGGISGGLARAEWRGRLESFESTGRYPVLLGAPATLAFAADRVELGETRLSGDWGHLDLITTRWTPAAFEAKGVARGVAVRAVTRIAGLRQAPSSNLVVGGAWDLRAAETIEGFAEFRRESGDVRVGEARQALGLETLFARVDASGGRVRAKADIRGTLVGQWQADGDASIRRTEGGWEVSPVAPVSGRLEVDVPDLSWTAAWLGPDALVGGKLAGRVALTGTPREPTWEGRIDGTGLAIRDPASGFEGKEGLLAITFKDHELRLEKFAFDSPWRPNADAAKAIAGTKRPDRGTLSAEGAINFETRKGEIRVKSAAYPVTQLATRFLAVSGEAKAALDGALIAVTGDLRADAGWFGIPASAAPSVADDVIVERGEPAPDAAPSERIRLDVRVALGDHTHFTGRGLTTRLAGSLRLAGDVGAGLRATGSIRAVDGTYDAYGQKLAIERGALNFQGPIDNPGLNVLALRKGLPVEAGVEILGNVARPRVRLVSQPDVPDPEKLAWLVLGRGQGQMAASDAAILVSAAGSILGRDDTQSGRLLGGLGLSPDDIRLGQDSGSLLGTLPQSTVAGKTGTTSTQDVLSVGKRLSDNIYLSYQQGLADAEGSMRVAWQVTKAFQVIMRAGYQPGVDAVYRFTLDDAPIKLRP